jgi:hypothetical protein
MSGNTTGLYGVKSRLDKAGGESFKASPVVIVLMGLLALYILFRWTRS